MKQTKKIALCGMMTALAAAIMLIGGVLGIGTYVSPMISGILLIPIGIKYGKNYHFMLWAAVSILSFILVPDIEQSLMFFAIFGLYPIIRCYFEKLPKLLGVIIKLLYFNAVTILLEWIVISIFMPETLEVWFTVTLLILGNVTFIMYDFILSHSELLLEKYLGRLMKIF